MVDGLTETVTDVMVGAAAPTVTVAVPETLVSSTEVAVIVAVPAAWDVNRPVLETVPMLDGLTDQLTAVL